MILLGRQYAWNKWTLSIYYEESLKKKEEMSATQDYSLYNRVLFRASLET